MDKELLVSFAQKSGASLLQKLREKKVTVTDAFWRFSDVDNMWNLYLATPLAEKSGLEAIRAVREALSQVKAEAIHEHHQENDDSGNEISELNMSDTFVTYADFPVIQKTRQQYGKVWYPTLTRPYLSKVFDKNDLYIFKLDERPTVSESTTNA